jgi:hypothetical protein
MKIYINKEVYCRKSSDMKSWRDQDSLTGKWRTKRVSGERGKATASADWETGLSARPEEQKGRLLADSEERSGQSMRGGQWSHHLGSCRPWDAAYQHWMYTRIPSAQVSDKVLEQGYRETCKSPWDASLPVECTGSRNSGRPETGVARGW